MEAKEDGKEANYPFITRERSPSQEAALGPV